MTDEDALFLDDAVIYRRKGSGQLEVYPSGAVILRRDDGFALGIKPEDVAWLANHLIAAAAERETLDA